MPFVNFIREVMKVWYWNRINRIRGFKRFFRKEEKMSIEKFLRIEKGKIYLKAINGTWKRFDNVLGDILCQKDVKLKQRRFRVNGIFADGGCWMGRDGDEIWIYAKLSQEEKEKTLIHEILEDHFVDDVDVMGNNEDLIEEITKKIWENKKCRKEIRDVLSVIQ